ncbi:MAG: hypothetical protein IJ773_01870 [Lachnospiraceae bacterium]|nr:hypothetical protein [Lachnospiraceae bacterium]
MKRKRLLWLIPILVAIVAVILWRMPRTNENQKMFQAKADILKAQVVTDATMEEIGDAPVESVGYVVFFSVSDGFTRAKVYNGTGASLEVAWDKAVKGALHELKANSTEPKWLRVDVVSKSWPINSLEILNELADTPSGFDYHGLSFDPEFNTAFPEIWMNGAGIYDYKDDRVSVERVNQWLVENDREPLKMLPDNMVEFDCLGWFCDENDEIYDLCNEGADTGRRMVEALDADYAKNIIDAASSFLMDQVKEDGSFIYGIRPQFDKEIDDYNILRHSGTIWSLICRYRMFPDDALKEKIDSTIGYMLEQLLYDEDGAAYLLEANDSELKLGANGIAVVTLTEYMDVFENEDYREICEALGEGILKQQGDDGSYWHVLFTDFSQLEAFRTVYYDGECTFALTRLYSLTGDQKWLDAACLAIDHFIEYDYTQYRDHWVAYSLNEVTKYVDKQEYYDFALANATNNYSRILGRWRTYPTNLELLISSFETWQRMVEKGIDTGDFEVQDLLDAIAARANRQLSGYFYPETAMFMQNPERILGSFMMRNDKFRVRIDDVQHNIGGYYLYWKNYDAMLEAGLDPGRMDVSKVND